jgi:predicted  nucleic acid-binding Zn-ribbon protein
MQIAKDFLLNGQKSTDLLADSLQQLNSTVSRLGEKAGVEFEKFGETPLVRLTDLEQEIQETKKNSKATQGAIENVLEKSEKLISVLGKPVEVDKKTLEKENLAST